jgi:predicted DNA-binding WGR domain protein
MKLLPDEQDATEIRAQVERETRRSRYRDRWSRERMHPIQHDVSQLIDFVMERRRRETDGARVGLRVLERVDTEALRLLVEMARRGHLDRTMRRRCQRVDYYCLVIEKALELHDALLEAIASVEEEEPND